MTEKISDTSRSTINTLSEQEKRDYYRAWESSGISKSDFCKKHGLSSNQLYYWHKLYKAGSTTEPKPFSPVVAKIISPHSQQNIAKLEIRLPNQAQLFITLHENRLVPFIQELCNAVTVIR